MGGGNVTVTAEATGGDASVGPVKGLSMGDGDVTVTAEATGSRTVGLMTAERCPTGEATLESVTGVSTGGGAVTVTGIAKGGSATPAGAEVSNRTEPPSA